MRSFPAIWGATFLLAGYAAAAEPSGEWRTANGLANVRIDDCDGVLWGIISWEKEPGGVDSYNPNAAERSRPTLGLHILLAMKPTKPGLWQGEVYNAGFANQPDIAGRFENRGLRTRLSVRRRELDESQDGRSRPHAPTSTGRTTYRPAEAGGSSYAHSMLRYHGRRGGGP